MRTRTLTSMVLALARKACGLALVVAACAGVAFAGGPPPPASPEIDPGSAASALGLLAGGLLMLTDRLRRKGV